MPDGSNGSASLAMRIPLWGSLLAMLCKLHTNVLYCQHELDYCLSVTSSGFLGAAPQSALAQFIGAALTLPSSRTQRLYNPNSQKCSSAVEFIFF